MDTNARIEDVKLSESFLDQYRGQQPKWGFGGLGYIVYLRTYARKKPDGTLESWDETVKRVTEGNFRIEAKRLAELGKLTPEKVRELNTEMERFYHLVFNLVMTPPGRGLWMSGTEYAERVGDAENNCLRGTERVFVKDVGLVPISELNGEVEVLSDGGVFRKAYFRSYGKQKLMKITFKDGQEVYATPDHEWIVLSGNSGRRKNERVKTKDLTTGTKIPIVRPDVPTEYDPEGVAHGFVFGDGTRVPGGYCRVQLYKNDPELYKIIARFGEISTSKIPTIKNLPYHYKKLPKIGEYSREYLLGFILGYIAADGHVRNKGIRLHCKDENVLEAVREIAQYIGLKVNPVRLEREKSPFTGELAPLYSISFSAETFPGHLLPRSDQRQKFKPSNRNTSVPYKEIKSVENTDLIEEVYCCNEPETHSFVIEGHLLTGNCWGISMRPNEYHPNDHIYPGPGMKVSFAPVFTFDQAMKGGGVGVNIQRKYVDKIPKVKNELKLYFTVDFDHKDRDELIALDNKIMAIPDIRKGYPKAFKCEIFKVPDSREGWALSLAKVIDAHYEGQTELVIDVSDVRPRGAEIKGFGGVASGPAPLVSMLQRVNEILNRRVGDYVTPTEWGDIIQNIGCCVVAGNVRRTALILIGDVDDKEYVESKNYSLEKNIAASQWRWASNNSVDISPDTDRQTLRDQVAVNVYYNGEPGYTNVELARNFGRIIDGFIKDVDGEVVVYNPCGEVTLPDGSPCNLFEINLPRIHELVSKGIEKETLYEEAFYLATKYAYRVTFRPYEWAITRDVVYRHRRLGVGITGFTDWVLLRFGQKAVLGFDDNGDPIFNKNVTDELDRFYRIVRKTNTEHARELESNPSIKVTTVKPSGTVSILMGVSPGQHFHWAPYMIRRVRLAASAPLVPILMECGYHVEPAIKGFNDDGSYVYDYNTVVVEFPVKAPTADHPLFQSAGDVPLREQAAIQALLATYWSDNAVSATLSFHKAKPKPVYFADGTMLLDKFGQPELKIDKRDEERVIEEITDVLDRYKGVIKSTSLLPYATDTYPQMPYEAITKERYEQMVARLTAKPWEVISGAIAAEDEEVADSSMECVGGACPLK